MNCMKLTVQVCVGITIASLVSLGALAPAHATEPVLVNGIDLSVNAQNGALPQSVDTRAKTVVSAESHTLGLGVGLPGEVVETTAVPLTGEAAAHFNGVGMPLLTTSLDGAKLTTFGTANGSQSLISIGFNAAPTQYDFPLIIPSDATVTLSEDGGAAITSATGTTIGTVAPAWAYDAAGVAVPTHFELVGTVLRQIVDHSDTSLSYPITADPRVSWEWWGVAVKLTHSETVDVASNFQPAYAATAFCLYVPVPIANVACVFAINLRLWTWQKPIKDAAAQAGRCAQLNAPYIGGVIAWNVTNEKC